MQVSTDALTCIYAYCSLKDVLQCTRVCKHWAQTAAVSPPLPSSSVEVHSSNIDALCASRFRGLINGIRCGVWAGNNILRRLAIHVPRIGTLGLYYSPVPEHWPTWSRLHTLTITNDNMCYALPPSLTDLTALPPPHVLATCTLLKILRVLRNNPVVLSPTYTRVLRTLPHLQEMHTGIHRWPYKYLLPLYELPRSNNVIVVNTILTTLDDDAPDLFTNIPNPLSVDISDATCDLDFLVQRMERVKVSMTPPHRYNTPDLLFSFLMRCTLLVCIELNGMYCVTVHHMRALAKHAPRIHTLNMTCMGFVETLDFLPTWPLVDVTITSSNFPENELIHITRLPLLRYLHIDRATDTEVSNAWRETLNAIPLLQTVHIR